MSESQEELLSRIKAEAIEARKHVCKKCGHPGSKHAFDIYRVIAGPNPCKLSCLDCMDKNTNKEKDTVN